ncbi:MAG: 16S rRNA (adenine(1518)-N(6)/adenine(1519)-N(6))-dimethyltransferase RsmA [Phycisphaerae bacterium]
MAGQTLSTIRSLLARHGLRPQHQFGQNFLIDLNLMRKLVDAADLQASDVIVEVGPGTGSLTEFLLESGAQVIAVEIDRGFQELLKQHFAGNPNLHLICGDALETKHRLNNHLFKSLRDLAHSHGGIRKLVANLPYQIATPLMLELLIQDELPFERLVCTIQREMADRLLAKVNTEQYGPAAVITQTFARIELLATLPPGAFWPPPNVASAFVRLVTFPDPPLASDERAPFAAFVQRGFQQRRKMLRGSMRDWGIDDPEAILAYGGFSELARPEQIAPSGWLALHRLCRPPSQA